jgi:RNA polymerase sigma-70 factor (ECF subfamily)
MQQPTDEELMMRVIRRDAAAFTELVERHIRRVVSLAHDIVRVAAEADEIAQETFLRLWERPQLFLPAKARFTTWLHRVTVNLCIDRKRTRRFDSLEPAPEQQAADPPLFEALHAARLRAVVNGALMALPIRQRTALVLFYMHELSQKDAAAVMEVSEGAFESLLQRARRALVSILAQYEEQLEKGV